MRATVTTLLLATLLVVLAPGAAWAHASFDLGEVPAGGTQELVLRVPLEREAANDVVEVLVPGGFVVEACAAAPGWTCEQAAADSGTVVTLRRGPDGAGDAERFALTITAPPTEGVYAFPTIQTYDDEVEASWIGEPGSDQPAPRLQVGDETTPVVSNGDASPHTELATPAPDASTEPGPAGEPSATPAPATPSAATSADPAPAEDAGPSLVLVVVGIALAAGAVAGAVARFRSL